MKRILEINAGEGGQDSQLLVKDFSQAYQKFASNKG
jgi:protein subunit release factor A